MGNLIRVYNVCHSGTSIGNKTDLFKFYNNFGKELKQNKIMCGFSVTYPTYGKCSKNSNTKVSDKMTYANSADPDQTAP